MSFLHPQFLYFMLPPLFILFGFLLTQKDSEAQFFSTEVMKKLRVGSNSMTQRMRNILLFMVSILMLLALAEPVIDDGKVLVKAKSADVMIAIDISDSMLAEDVYPNRLELAKQKALSFIEEIGDERVGVMAFAKNSFLVSPLSFDKSAVSFLLKQLDTNSITQKGTNFLSILEVFAKLQDKKDEKYLLILSDGGDDSDLSKEIELAKKNSIVVFVLGIATKEGAPVKKDDGTFVEQNGKIIISKLNEEIATLCTKSGGAYIESTLSNADVTAMLKEIRALSKAKELKSQEINKYTPLFYYPLALALFLLLIATSSKRVKLQLPTLLMLCVLGLFSVETKASMLDFVELDAAKKAYESEDYKKASEIYEEYAKKSQKSESYYNAGNALYKQKEYKKAVEAYERATFDTKEMESKNLSNLGSAYAKSQELEKAVEAYESSLKLEEDKDTRENLERVKELLEQKQKQKEEQKEDKKEDKDDSGESDDEDKKGDSKEKESSSNGSQEKKSDEAKSKEDDKDEQKETREAQEKKEQKQQLDELNSDEKKNEEGSEAKEHEQMSDAEERKWIDELNVQKGSYLYQLDEEKPTKDMSDEKPW